ncbi:hypothetical protein [Clostridium sp.]|jgi:hypothetical protein|uniref:hypothetical protein n=1 Tax=Clostridium sp. TaxID=1506 RepID=UPI002583BFC9|nr:hypothetical protein [Clostridium sp.]MDF2505194.1 hypothetical protein [Clostridium sp.]
MHINKSSEDKAIKILNTLKNRNISIILEPYPWISDGIFYETDWNPSNIDMFFYNWENNVLKNLINEVANPYNVDAVIVTSNFVHMEHNEKNWCNTIDYVKK